MSVEATFYETRRIVISGATAAGVNLNQLSFTLDEAEELHKQLGVALVAAGVRRSLDDERFGG